MFSHVYRTKCMASYSIGSRKSFLNHVPIKAEPRISIKEYPRGKNPTGAFRNQTNDNRRWTQIDADSEDEEPTAATPQIVIVL